MQDSSLQTLGPSQIPASAASEPDSGSESGIEFDDNDLVNNYADETIQKFGVAAFHKFERQIIDLDRELRNFANAGRQLGSSVDILSSSFHMREDLAQILFMFRENAADLFPRKVSRKPYEALVNHNSRRSRKHRKGHKTSEQGLHDRALLPNNYHQKLDIEYFPQQFLAFSNDISILMNGLDGFPEFTDEAVNKSITAVQHLRHDLKFWASCLSPFEGQLRSPAVRKYLQDLTSDIGEQLEDVTASLSVFIAIGIPSIRFSQQHASQKLMNVSTMATIFTAVAATTMQFSYTMTTSALADAVNALWFSALVFSIGSAINSLLGVIWTQAVYRSPHQQVPWWVSTWIQRSPLVFLVLSISCFSLGLVFFAYSSGQNIMTSTLTTIFSGISCSGIVAVSAWILHERWKFNSPSSEHWPVTDSSNITKSYRDFVLKWMNHLWRMPITYVLSWVRRICQKLTSMLSSMHNWDDITQSISIVETNKSVLSEERHRPSAPAYTRNDNPKARARFRAAGQAVILLRWWARSSTLGSINHGRSSAKGNLRRWSMLEPTLDTPRFPIKEPQLQTLNATHQIEDHMALVRHLQFSPDGRFLVTSSWDRTSMIYCIEPQPTLHRTLVEPHGFFGGKVIWSPSGIMLLAQLRKGVKVWTHDGVCMNTIYRHKAVQSIAWLPGGEGFVSVEGSDVVQLDLNGNVIGDPHTFGRMELRDVAVTGDRLRLLCIGLMTTTADNLSPLKCRPQQQIIVYDLEKRIVEKRVPVLDEMCSITMAQREPVEALISYGSEAPPQLWRMEIVRGAARLVLQHTYMPDKPADFAGPACFGGSGQQLILCAEKTGVVHIWDRQTGAILHRTSRQSMKGKLTCIASNHKIHPCMFATGSHDGVVNIWTSSPEPSFVPSPARSIRRLPKISLPEDGSSITQPGDDVFSESPSDIDSPTQARSWRV